MHVTDMPLEQLLLDIDCIFMYQDLANSKIKIDQVFDLKLDDVRSMTAPIGDLKRFITAIAKYQDARHSLLREKKINIAGSWNDFSHIQVLIIQIKSS